jgi:hypothetical protein
MKNETEILSREQIETALISRAEALAIVDVTPATLSNWAKWGWLVPVKVKGFPVAYVREEVERFFREGGGRQFYRKRGRTSTFQQAFK